MGSGGGAANDLAVLDAAALGRLRELDPSGKAGLLSRVLDTYVQTLERLLVQLRAARAASDAAAIRHVAHTLKSSSASVGALDLSSLCADVEARLRDEGLQGLPSQLDKLVAEGERVLAGLSSRPRPA
jgi:HPt (histidine-containing phosphotransfer) domain-containing protein